MGGVAITRAEADLERCLRVGGRAFPGLVTLARLATAAEEPACAERADIRTLAERSPYRRMTALLRVLALAAGRRAVTESGLALDLPAALLDREFGRGHVVHFEDVDLPPSLTHTPTRRFLRDMGLPEAAFPLRVDTDAPLRTLEEHAEDRAWADGTPLPQLPPDAARLIHLGILPEPGTSLLLDGRTGSLSQWTEPTAELHALGMDLSTWTCTVWLTHRALRSLA